MNVAYILQRLHNARKACLRAEKSLLQRDIVHVRHELLRIMALMEPDHEKVSAILREEIVMPDKNLLADAIMEVIEHNKTYHPELPIVVEHEGHDNDVYVGTAEAGIRFDPANPDSIVHVGG